MTQDALFLLLVALIGLYTTRWTMRLAPLWSELPAKSVIATVLAALVFSTSFTTFDASSALRWSALILAPLYVFAPWLLTVLARARRYRLAKAATTLLYWTADGRSAVRRLLAQAALQQGDADEALALAAQQDALLLAQAYALKGDWSALLELDLPDEGDNAYLGWDARVEAQLALGRHDAARASVAQMQDAWNAGKQGPIGYRSLALSQARLDAEDGEFEKVREAFKQPLPGLRPHVVYEVLARAAERTGRPDVAVGLYEQAFLVAPPTLQARFAERLRLLGREAPSQPKPRRAAIGTLWLAGALVLVYIAQVLSGRIWGDVIVLGQRLDLASYVGAFLLNVPGVAAEHAWWRFLSYGLLHANLLHIGFNVWVLVDLGRIYELRRGWGNVLAAFVVGTAMGAYLSSVAQAGQSVVLVGASGGILGIAGALLADAIRSKVPADRALMRGLLQWIAIIGLFSVAVPNVSLWGHAGGVVGGLLWGFLRQGLPADSRIDTAAGAVAVLVLSLSAVLAIVNGVLTLG